MRLGGFWLRSGEGRLLGGCPGLPELEEVVGGADQRPLRLHRLQATTEELAKAPRRLDLAEDRLHRLLSKLVLLFALGAVQPLSHRVPMWPAVRGASWCGVGAGGLVPPLPAPGGKGGEAHRRKGGGT